VESGAADRDSSIVRKGATAMSAIIVIVDKPKQGSLEMTRKNQQHIGAHPTPKSSNRATIRIDWGVRCLRIADRQQS
jgi:hypothetical protein